MEDPAFIRPDRSTARRRSCLLMLALCGATLWLTDATVRRMQAMSPEAAEPIFAVAQPSETPPVKVQTPTARRVFTAVRRPASPPRIYRSEYTRQVRRTVHLYQSIIQKVARRYKVHPALVKAIIMAESGYDPKAVSDRGAQGLMQLMPETADMLGVSDSFDPEHNITAGVRYFRQLVDRFDGNPTLALAAYNAGPGNVQRHQGIPPYQTTRRYLKKVLAYYDCYRKVGQGQGSAEDA